MQLEPRVGKQPFLDRRRLVSGAVIEHDVDVEPGRDFAVDRVEKPLELDRSVASVQRAQHLAGAEVQGGVEARRAVALVVVRGALGDPGQHRQDRRRAVEGLDLGLLVDAEHDRALGRVEIEPDDVVDLVDEQRVFGEFEGVLAMRLEPERSPDPRHRRLREPDLCGHRPRRPVRRVLRRRLKRLGDHRIDLVVGDRPRPPRPRLVGQPVKPVLGEPAAPLGDHAARHAQLASQLSVRSVAIGHRQHDPRPQRKRLRASSGVAPTPPAADAPGQSTRSQQQHSAA